MLEADPERNAKLLRASWTAIGKTGKIPKGMEGKRHLPTLQKGLAIGPLKLQTGVLALPRKEGSL